MAEAQVMLSNSQGDWGGVEILHSKHFFISIHQQSMWGKNNTCFQVVFAFGVQGHPSILKVHAFEAAHGRDVIFLFW